MPWGSKLFTSSDAIRNDDSAFAVGTARARIALCREEFTSHAVRDSWHAQREMLRQHAFQRERRRAAIRVSAQIPSTRSAE